MKSRFGLGSVKLACAGLALAAAMGSGSAASAAQVLITDGQMHNPLVVQLSGSAYNGAVYDAAMNFTASFDGASSVSILAFCVDVFHDINFGPYSPGLQYQTTVPFTTDSRPSPTVADNLTGAQIEQIERLVTYGTDVQNDGSLSSLDKSIKVAAVQGAIWQIAAGETVTLASGWSQNAGVDATSFDTLVNGLSSATYANDFGSKYGAIGDKTVFLTPLNYPDATGTQSFLFAVPEPATWLLMVVGIGLLGAQLRLRRRQSQIQVLPA